VYVVLHVCFVGRGCKKQFYVHSTFLAGNLGDPGVVQNGVLDGQVLGGEGERGNDPSLLEGGTEANQGFL
jgi:hypothetical protein